MKTIHRIATALAATAAIFALNGCVNEDVFERSDRNTPTEIRFVGQLNSKIKYGDGTTVHPDTAFVQVEDTYDLTDLTIDYLSLPSLSKVSPDVNRVKDFAEPVEFIITSESGRSVRKFVVVVEYGAFSLQLPYYKLDTWYEMGQFDDGRNYFNIGEKGTSTPWANSNTVAKILKKAACVPSNYPNSPTGHVLLGTLMNPTGGKTVGSGIASANLFTGHFRANPNAFLDRDRQRDNVSFGIPYRNRPTSVSFEYKYMPGSQVEKWISCSDCGASKWKGVDLNESDSLDVWVVLHHRIYDETNPANTRFLRIAAGGFMSSETVSQWQRISIPIVYGKPTDGFVAAHPEARRIRDINQVSSPRFVYQHNPIPKPDDPSQWSYTTYRIREEWSANPVTEEVTHLSLSFNSSAGGWEFRGAGTDDARGRIGSKLEVRNIIFEE